MWRLGLFGLNPLTLGTLIAALAAAVYGAHTPAERAVYADGGSVSLVVVVTTWMRVLPMALFCIFTRKALFQSQQDIKQSFIGGVFQALSIICILSAVLYLPAPVVIIIIFSHTLMLLFFMAWRSEVKLDAITVSTTVIALGGLSFVIDLWHKQSTSSWVGIALSFIAAFAIVGRMYVYGHQTKERHPIVVGAENFLVAAPLASLMLLFAPVHLPETNMGYVWVGVASLSLALGSFCMFYGISLIGSFRYSLFGKLEPVFTSLFSIWFLGEFLKPVQYVGIAIVVGSLTLYQISEQKRMKRA
jgi:probable blue pigment (indigoidine) exporter